MERPLGAQALLCILGEVLQTGAAFGLLLLFVGLWQHEAPVPLPRRGAGLDRQIIGTQIERAESIPKHIDVLTVGDSSGLMGVDPILLGRLLGGARVESLNAIGYIGPRGFAALLQRFYQSGGRANRVVILLHGSATKVRTNWQRYERMAVQGIKKPPPPRTLLGGIRAKLLSIVEPILYAPMQGPWGDFYGRAEAMADMIRSHHGGADEPRRTVNALARGMQIVEGPYPINDLFVSALNTLAETIIPYRDSVRILFTPYGDWFDDDEEVLRKQREAQETIGTILRLRASQWLDTPATLPEDLFGSGTHLNVSGQRIFTEELAAALQRDRERFPWGTKEKQPATVVDATCDDRKPSSR